MTTKQNLTVWLLSGLTSCLITVQQAPGAAARKSAPSKTTTAGISTPSAKPGVISRDPYVGAIALDAATGQVLFEEGADLPGYPASVLKLMDLLIVLEKIQQGRLSLQEPVTVSAGRRASAVPRSGWPRERCFPWMNSSTR
jgi:D-alanyl-D-alanine carboxypeptidase